MLDECLEQAGSMVLTLQSDDRDDSSRADPVAEASSFGAA